ncbi:ATP-binding protein [Variovorax sp. M-6]|uniref:ATP-binding protein n=1 Tax=Variovorax sp. M-6 TaxID=3233041 RepID=UPI003F963A99
MIFGHTEDHCLWFYAFAVGFALCLVLSTIRNRSLRIEMDRRLAAKAELSDQLAFQQATLEGIPYAICVRDAEARQIFCNAAYEKLFGTTREAMERKTVSESGLDYVDPEHMNLLHERYLGLLADHGTISEDVDVFLDGQTRRILHWAAPISLKEGAAAPALIAGAIDITERQHLIEQIETALAQAQEANRAKSNFLATMSHEIRTPMNAVLGLLELLVREGRLNAKDRESVDLACSSAQSLLGLIDDILDISKIEAGGLEIVLAPTRLRPILEEVAKVFGGMARQRGLAIALDVDPAVGEWHVADATRFRQIVNNLVSNAIKYTDTGGVTLRLRRANRTGDTESIVLEVEDSGIGIASEDVANLFRPFFQAEAAGPRAIGGTGLGLPIVQRLCRKMGGTIEVRSQRGQGTCIRVAFDLVVVPAPLAEALPAIRDDGEPGRPWRWRGKVLAVDDHPANRLLLRRQLDHLGLDCELAENGETALELWRDGGFDLVITDCSMPVMDGYALATAIRELERERHLPRCPVLGCTAHVQEEERRRALEVGMDECLMKPFSLDGLSAALHRHLRADLATPPSAPPPQAPAGRPFDPLALRSLSDGDARIEARFLEALLRSNLGDLRQIVEHVESGELPEAASMAHRIKGAARMVHAERVVQACDALELACRGDHVSSPTAGLALLAERLDELNRSIEVQLADLAQPSTHSWLRSAAARSSSSLSRS